MLQVAETANKGRGVFTRHKILAGQIIEHAPVIVVPKSQKALIVQTILADYYFDWDENYQQVAIGLGLSSIYNHSYAPNACYTKRYSEQLIEYTALRDIEADEEITVNYNGRPDSPEPLWFGPEGWGHY